MHDPVIFNQVVLDKGTLLRRNIKTEPSGRSKSEFDTPPLRRLKETHSIMNETRNNARSETSRREFLKTTGQFAAASALAGIAIPHVHAAGSDLVQICLIGCGGRGGGAAANALGTNPKGPVKLVAMADVFEDKLNNCYTGLEKNLEKTNEKDLMDVPQDR